jgi:flagellar biosynthesis/type III secretory pathway protein FliH
MGKAEGTLKKMPEHFAVPSTIDTGSKTWNETIFGSGYNMGYEAGKKEAKLEKVDQFNKGYEIGKKSNGYSSDDINQLHIDMEHTRKIWYAHGKEEGYKEGYTTGFDNGLDAATIANTTAVKPSPCNHGECIAHIEEARLEGYADGFKDAKEGGYAEGYKDGPQEEPSTNTSGIKESEYDKGYYAGWEDGKNHIMQFI